MDLILDFNVDPSNGGLWKRITATQAKGMKSCLQNSAGGAVNLTDGELEGMLAAS